MPYTEQHVADLARRAYEHGVASFTFTADTCALLVIDMQDEFVTPGIGPSWVPDATRQIPRIKTLIDGCRSKQIPVIYTIFAPTHHYLDRPLSGPTMPNRYPDIDPASLPTMESRVCDELTPAAGDVVIQKPSYGAFYDTPLETILKRLGRDTVIICGTMTNFCCGTTARQAYERSFKVIMGSDVCATDLPEMQEAELKVLRKGFAKVMTADEIMAAL